MTTTTLRRRKANMYGIAGEPPAPHFYAFFFLDGTTLASIYSDAGTWVSDRFEDSVEPGSDSVCINGDEEVGDGSVAWSEGDFVYCWDVEAETLFSYEVTAGKTASGVLYSEGSLYWWEAPPTFTGGTDVTVVLREGNCELDSVADVGDEVAETGAVDNTDFTFGNVGITETYAYVDVTAEGGETSVQSLIRIPLGGGAGNVQTDEALDLGPAMSDGAGAMVAPTGQFSGPTVLRTIPEDMTGDDAVRWPTTGNWELDGTRKSFTTSADHETAMLYAEHDGDNVAVEAPCIAISGQPTLRVTLEQHPTELVYPTLLFLME